MVHLDIPRPERLEGVNDVAIEQFPRFARVRRHRDLPRIADGSAATRAAVGDISAFDDLPEGAEIAVTAGSRRIHDMLELLEAAVAELQDRGFDPFVMPVMGSHGGATPQGQREVLASYDITEERLGCEIRASMDTETVAENDEGWQVPVSSVALDADAVLLANRVKLHTDFRGDIESGLAKMVIVGLGKQRGAEVMHNARLNRGLGTVIPERAGLIFENAPVGGGIALVDNGRLAMRDDDQLWETLYCIRCGACANSCSNFQLVGGHAFDGETYTGGIATGWEVCVHGQDAAADFNDFCTGCFRCVTACPVKIDIPWINTVVRDRLNRANDPETFDFLVEGLTPDDVSGGLDVQKRVFGNFETLAKLGSATAPLSNWFTDLGPVRTAMDRYLGVDPRRDLPSFKRETLVDWFERRRPRSPNATADCKVVLYLDVYRNYVLVDWGKAAVQTLEALGVHVKLATPAESGRAPLFQGMISTATEHARIVADDLNPYLEADFDVVVIEPSDVAMFRREYAKLVNDEVHACISENSYEVIEYVYGLFHDGADRDVLADPDGSVAYHSHCQQRTLGLEAYTEAVLSNLGFDVLTSDVECCGMAGSFGYKSEYYELSMDVGSDLEAQFADETNRTLVASGTSCTEQMETQFGQEVTHPVELLDPSKSGST